MRVSVGLRGLKNPALSKHDNLSAQPSTEPGQVQRILLYDGQRRLIATWSLDRATGVEHLHLLDDRTGWWVHVRMKLGVRSPPGEEYPQFSQRREAWLQPGQGHQIEIRVRTSTGFESEKSLPASLDFDGLLADLVEELEQQEAWGDARRGIPTEALTAAEGWRGLLRYESNASLAIAFLNGISRTARNAEEHRLTVSKTQMRSGTRPDSPRWQELLRTFDHFDPDDPLPEDLFEPVESP